MRSPNPEERQRWPAYPNERLVTVQVGDGSPPHQCLLTNLSEGGVRLHVNGFGIPDEFVAHFSKGCDAQDGTYRVTWRLGREVGATYIGYDPQPDALK